MAKSKSQIAEVRKKLQDEISEGWPHRKGKNEFLKSLDSAAVIAGNTYLTRKEAMLAMCYFCCGGYEGGPYDCVAYTCPLYSYQPYRDARSRKEMTEEQKAQFVARLRAGKEKARQDDN